MPSNFRAAVKQMLAVELLFCPKCGDCDLPKAKPTLEKEQDGSYTCRSCAHHWKPKEAA